MAFGGNQGDERLVEQLTYDTDGHLMESKKWEDDGACETNTYVYNEHGKVIEHTMFLEPDDISERFVMERDSQGRLLCETKYYGDDPGDKTVFEYGEWENPIRISRYDPDGVLETVESFEYDDSGNPVSHAKSDATQKQLERSEIRYHENGKPSHKTLIGPGGNTAGSTELMYDEEGRVVRASESNAEGKLISDVVSQYDERSNVILRHVRDFNTRVLRFEYNSNDQVVCEEIVDGNGNLILRNTMEYDTNGLLVSETEFWLDTGRGRGDGNSVSRYEYEFD
jgi:hypothetical protein